jgi:potassium uptake TrkH family protein
VRTWILGRPTRAVVSAFVLAIVIGTVLLEIPIASTDQGSAPRLTALFTATSAITVTGLTPVDPATYWTPFGQAVILVLIQLGGLGIMTSASLFLLLASKRIGLRARLAAQAETHTLNFGDLRRLVLTIVVFTAAFEAIAITVLTVRLWAIGRSPAEALWQGTFHGISAFNNAGFSIYSDNLIGFAADAWVLITIAVAVICGGLGFPVWLDLRQRLTSPARWSLHTKLTLSMTGALLAGGTLMLTALEWRDGETLGGLTPAYRVLGGFFMATMPRTAGFNAVDYSVMDESSLLVTDMLMFAGGGAGGTAGGLKVTTLAVLFMVVWAEVRGDREVVAFRRRIPRSVLRQALTVAVISINLVVAATLGLMITNHIPLSDAVFEATSAFATVGLSTGITADLNAAGQALLVPVMLLGRIGPLTLFVALVLRERERLFTHPEERPIIG